MDPMGMVEVTFYEKRAKTTLVYQLPKACTLKVKASGYKNDGLHSLELVD